MKTIFVFGSNLQGIHGAGAALHARRHFGAELGVGQGRTGDAYAIPTKATCRKSLTLEEIRPHVAEFILYAQRHPELTFNVTRVGCGLAGFIDDDIAPMFADAPVNCLLPAFWR